MTSTHEKIIYINVDNYFALLIVTTYKVAKDFRDTEKLESDKLEKSNQNNAFTQEAQFFPCLMLPW